MFLFTVEYTTELKKVWVYGYDANHNKICLDIFSSLDKLIIDDMEAQITKYYEQ